MITKTLRRNPFMDRAAMLAAIALAFKPTSSRSGAMMQVCPELPGLIRNTYRPPNSGRGLHKHASEVRAAKKSQRRRAYHQMCKRR